MHLNRAMKQPIYPFAPVNDIFSALDLKAKFFVTLDCVGGYWQVAHSKKSQKLVAFLTEWGGYTYLRAPMGLTSSSDIFCACMDKALAVIPGLHKLVDDLIVYRETKRQLMACVYLVMEHYRKHDITLSASKALVGEEVKFASVMVGGNGIKANPGKMP